MKVQKVVKEALGGVLFIDEAYALVQGGRDNFGVEAVDTLIKEMEDNRAHLIVILAGYTKEMEDFFNSNPGFQSRVPFSFHFVDYNCPELVKIGELQLKSKTMSLKASESCTEGSACWWLRRTAQLSTGCCDEEDASRCVAKNDRSNGNGRTMRNLLESSFRHMALRVLKSTEPAKLKEFAQALPSAPEMNCQTSSNVSMASYSGTDMRCLFSLLEANDIIDTTVAMVNLNLAPCKMSLTQPEVEMMSHHPSTWQHLADALSEVSATKTGAQSRLQAACASLRGLLTPSPSGALLELGGSMTQSLEKGPDLSDYSEFSSRGFCKDKYAKQIRPAIQKRVQLNECKEFCDSKLSCTSFAIYTGGCYIYTGVVPRYASGRSSVRCFVKKSAAATNGVALPAQPTRVDRPAHGHRPSHHDRPSPPPSPHHPPARPNIRRPNPYADLDDAPTVPGAGIKHGFDDRDAAADAIQEVAVPGGTNVKVDTLMAKLNKLVGLSKVKAGMGELRAMVEFDQWRKTMLPDSKSLMGQSFHMQFLGNPGTGKTVVARLVGELLVEMGVITKEGDDVVFEEVARADLVAEYKGQTAPKVISAVEKAIGGVLFIDEAYSLKKEGKDAFGQEAVDTLIKEIEDKRDKVIAIFAGYEKEMETFFEANPGFKSRVPFKFYFDDYTCSELSQIAGIFMEDKGFRATDGAQLWVNRTVRFATGCCDTGDCQAKRDSGNGRTVRNILEAAYRNFASRIVPRLYYSGDFPLAFSHVVDPKGKKSNKVGMLIKGCPGLATVDSEKLARAVDKAWKANAGETPLAVMIQVNSSGEETKNGVEPSEVAALCKVIATECEGLRLAGLMTIGAPDYSGCRTEDFETLKRCRAEAAAVMGVSPESLELSMGMSSDYENAIREGSTSVRVGSSIFGARHYPAK
ncbi:unnamed protein product [Effrenium voratum]|nr:unnamed protein product [Effrenium voratum]